MAVPSLLEGLPVSCPWPRTPFQPSLGLLIPTMVTLQQGWSPAPHSPSLPHHGSCGTLTGVTGINAFSGLLQHDNSFPPAVVSMGCCRGRHRMPLINMCEIICSSKEPPPCCNAISKY